MTRFEFRKLIYGALSYGTARGAGCFLRIHKNIAEATA